jgi:CRISPR-associated protein Cas2
MKGFGYGLHYSVFRCDLSRKGRVEMVACIEEVINHAEDRVMIVDLGPLDGSAMDKVDFIGKMPDRKPRGAVIV